MRLKKNFVFLILAAIVIFPSLFLLTACGGKEKVYGTIASAPEHTSIVMGSSGDMGTDNQGSYFEKDQTVTISLYIDKAYTIGTLQVLVDGSPISLTEETSYTDGSLYEASFVASQNFSVSFSGEISEILSTLVLGYDEWSDLSAYENDIFVKFKNYEQLGLNEEYTLKQYIDLANSRKTLHNVKASETFEVYVYTKNYNLGLSSDSSFTFVYGQDDSMVLLSEFYHTDNEYGFHYSRNIYRNAVLNFTPIVNEKIVIDMVDENNQFTNDSGVFKLKVDNAYKTYVDFSDFNAKDEVAIAFEFENISNQDFETITNGLYFKISANETPVNFTKQGNAVLINVQRPYFYALEHDDSLNSQFGYRYYIQTNLLQNILKTQLVKQIDESFDVYVDSVKLPYENDNKPAHVTMSSNYLVYNENGYIVSKNARVPIAVYFVGDVEFSTLKIAGETIAIANNLSDIVISREYASDTNFTIYTIEIDAAKNFDKLEFFH